MDFTTTIEQTGKTTTGIVVPESVVEALGAGKRPAVSVTVNGYTYRSSIASMGGRYLISLSAEHRTASGLAGGDEVQVSLELDTAPREVAVPDDLAQALQDDPEASRIFEGLSYSRRLRLALSVDGAKTAETRARRVVKALSDLHEGKA
jgi:hypothetical protein